MDGTTSGALRARLRNVRWIGGPPDAGKSTVAGFLGAWFGVDVYRQDRHEMEHIRRADPIRQPRHAALRRTLERPGGERAFFQSWVERTAAELTVEARATWEERISMICDDLIAMGPDRTIVAEGPGFFPDAIAPLLSSPHQAISLVPSEAFKRASHQRRDKSAWRFMTSDPERALDHHIARDLILADDYRRELWAAGLPWIEVDGTMAAEGIARRVAGHFRLT